MLDKLFNLYIGRVVVALSVLLTPFAVAFANWVLDNTGVDLPSKDITVILVAFVLGVAAIVYKWLHNRGAYERALLELEKVYGAGRDIYDEAVQADPGPVPVTTASGAPAFPGDIPKRP